MPNTSVRVPKLEACHADTCLPDYWGGHHLPHLQVAVHREMTIKGLKEELINALHDGCVCGAEAPAEDDREWFRQARMAVENIAPVNIAREAPLFPDLEPETDDDSTVYAFFVFREVA